MKKLYLFAALAAMLAACSENDLTQSSQTQENNEQAVMFDAYVNRATTRAGQLGTIDPTTLRTANSESEKTGGFGVFGYYTNNELYSQNSKPEFFYNQKVYYNSTWTYSPIKYWPNEFGSSAESHAEDRLTFFAYAPYVPVDVSTGIAQQTKNGSGAPIDELETGIISLTRNTALGDPYVKYYASFDPEKCVDLCFGVAKENFKSSVDGLKNNVVAGTPYVDVKKPTLNDRIYFDFKHALAQLNVQIDADVDEMSHGIEGLADGTKIYVREVTFEGIADKGMLNLYSEAKSADYTPKWVDLSGINEIKSGKVTIYDGRRDGREGQENAKASNEKPSNLNPEIIQTESTTNKGVVGNELQNLFDGSSLNAPVLVIPTGDVMRVTIVYDVETVDNNLATFLSDGKRHGSVVENKITKEITLNGAPLKLAAGKSYIVKMHLGMTSVKFNAAVTAWSDYSTGDVDLPVNAPTYVAGNPGTINLPSAGALAGQTFVLTGITGTVNASTGYVLSGGGVIAATPTGTLDGSNLTVTYSTNANTTVNNRSETITITETDGGQTSTVITVKQPAGALGLSINAVNATTGKEITIKAEASGIAVADWAGFNYTVIRKRNGETKTFVKDDAAAAGKYVVAGVDATKATITFDNGDVFETGDEYSITVQAGDALAETQTFVIGGISYAPSVKTLYKVVGSPKFTNVPDGPGTIQYNLTTPGSAINTVDLSTGEVELKTAASTTASVVTATTNATSSGNVYITDKSKSDTYTVYLTHVNVDGVYSVDKNGGDFTIILGALPKSTATPATPTTDDATMVTALACAAAPTDGVTTVTCTVAENAGATRTATITINGCKFYITQASGL